MIRQLDVPLRTLAPNRRVYIVRNGLVYQYPARIVRDMANDMWVGPEDDICDVTPEDIVTGDLLREHYMRGTPRTDLSALCSVLWNARSGSSRQFESWWSAVDSDDVETIAIQCAYAARNVMTWSLFAHRNEVDTSGLGA